MMRSPEVVHLASIVALVLGLASCEQEYPPLSPDDWRRIYILTLDALHEEMGEPEEIFLAPRPRFIVESDDGAMRMGAFNRYGDPSLTAAIDRHPRASACETGPGEGCNRAVYSSFVEISEILEVGPRDVGVMAAAVDFNSASGGVRDLVFGLRRTGEEWRVIRVDRGDEAWVR
jgi:hypothetical protein